MIYPIAYQPPAVYVSGSNPDHARYMQYYWTEDVDNRILDVVNTDNMSPEDIPSTLPFVTAYHTEPPTRLFGQPALDFLTEYLEHVSTRPAPTPTPPTPADDPDMLQFPQ